MSTSENCSQLSQTLPKSNGTQTQEKILSKDGELIQNANNFVDDLDNENSPFDNASQNEMSVTQQSDLLNSNFSFQSSSLPNNSLTSVDMTHDAHTIDLPPSSPDTLSQDSQENDKDIEEFLDTFYPEPTSSPNVPDHDTNSLHEISDVEDSSDQADSTEFEMDESNYRYGLNSFEQLPFANYMLTAHDQLRLCLDKNLQYQAWIKHQLQLIEYVEMKLREDQEKLQTLAKNATKGTRAQAKNMITLRKFFPYFRDQNGLPPPVDKSAIKNEAHQYGLYDKPASKWTDKERQDLAKGVRMQNLEALCRPMLLELENVTEPRGREIKREIEMIKRKPDNELELNLDGIEWDKLAIDMTPNRHPVECKLQWIQIDHPMVSRKSWNKQEDKALLKLAKENKERDWNTIAMRLKSNRTPVQCLQRYQTALNTEHVKREWSGDDDEKLREAVAKCGVGNWQEVANYMGNSHTGAQCLNRWDKTIKPTFRKGKWTEEEDDLLKRGVDMYGIGNWKKIASIVTSRTDVQCRERWVNILDPTIDHVVVVNCSSVVMKSSLGSGFHPQCVSSPVTNEGQFRLLIPPDITNTPNTSREILLDITTTNTPSVFDVSNLDAKFLEDFLNFSQEFKREVSHTSQIQICGFGKRLSFLASQDLISDLLKLSNWSLPPTVLEAYKNIGIECMFRWQVECLMKQDVLIGRNLIYSAPTSSGKTLVAEMLILKRILEVKKKAIYVLPYISIVNEKVHHLKQLLKGCGLRVGGFMGGSTPRGGFPDIDIAVCTIEKANSLVNRLIEERTLKEEVCIIVVDEIHMVSDLHRGYLLELLLTKVKYVTHCPDSSQLHNPLQIVGMSATLPNLDTLSKWLSAEFYSADFRPVELKEMILCNNVLYDTTLTPIRTLPTPPGISENIIHLCSETLLAGHSLLIFCRTKKWCETMCNNIRKFIEKNPKQFGIDLPDKAQANSIYQMLIESCIQPDPVLVHCLPYRVGFHHAGLTIQEREIIEGAFSSGTLRILTATSTLSSGVNLPARRVIIRSLTQIGNKVIEPVTYRQMCGRAGRTGLDDYGESILVCGPGEMEKARALLNATLKPVQSCLNTNTDVFQHYGVKRALLEVISCGIVRSRSEAQVYIRHTLLATTLESTILERIVNECFKFLLDCIFIEYKQSSHSLTKSDFEEVAPTQLGSATLSSSLSPDEALFVIDEINRARQCFVLENDLHMVYLVTPICLRELWSEGEPKWKEYMNMIGKLERDMKSVADKVGISDGYITSCITHGARLETDKDRKLLAIHRRFRAALALNELVREVHLHDVAKKFDLPKGQLQSLQISAGTFAGMVTVFCRKLGFKNIELLISQLQTRLEFGIEQELNELVRISLLNGYRARALYTAGFHNLVLIAAAGVELISKTLRDAHPFHRNEPSDNRKNWISALRQGLTVREIAAEVVEEAKQLLEQSRVLPVCPDSPPAPSQPLSSVITPVNKQLMSSNSNIHFRRVTGDNLHRSIRKPLFLSPTDTDTETETETSPPKRIRQDTTMNSENFPEDPLLQVRKITTTDPVTSLNDSQHQHISNQNQRPILSEISDTIPLESGSIEFNHIKTTDNSSQINSMSQLVPSSFQDADGFLKRFESSQNSVMDVSPPPSEHLIKPQPAEPIPADSPKLLSPSLEEDREESIDFVLTYSPTQSPFASPKSISSPNIPAKPVVSTSSLSYNDFLYHSLFDNTTLSLDKKIGISNATQYSAPLLTPDEWISDKKQESNRITFSQIQKPIDLDVDTILRINITPNSDEFHKLEEKCSSYHFSFSLSIKSSNLFSSKIASSPVAPDLLHGIALYFGGNEVFYIDQSPPIPLIESESLATSLSILSLLKPPTCLVAWGIKSKLLTLLKCNIRINALLADPQVAIWLLNPESDILAFSKHFSVICSYPYSSSSWLDRLDYGTRTLNTCSQAILSLLLMQELEVRLRQENIYQVFLYNEMPAVANFAILEVNGMCLDSFILEQNSVQIENELKLLSQKAQRLVGDNFDLSRESEVARILFTSLKLPIPSSHKPVNKSSSPRRNKHPSTSRDVLLELTDKHPVVNVIMAHRRQNYSLNRCLYPLKKALINNRNTGMCRVYPKSNYHTVTGRVTLEDPDLQHTPKDFDVPDSISNNNVSLSMRSTFTANPGYVLISADFSQLELRILTHLCRDPTLVAIFSSSGDIFKLIASSFYKVLSSKVSDTQRFNAKQICYGIVYGMGCVTLAKKMNIPVDEATKLISSFKDRFKEIDTFMEKLVNNCKELGYVESILGRKRYIKNLNSKSSYDSGEARRRAINTKIQSSASDLVKLGLNNIFKELHNQNIGTTLSRDGIKRGEVLFCNFLHDELIFEVSEHLVHRAGDLIQRSLANVIKLELPLPVVVKYGTSWGKLVRKWTREEDEILLRFVAKFGPGKWSQLASVMGSRTDNMVMRRWEKLNKPGVVAKYRLLRLKAKFARGADSKVKATLEPEDLDISILPEKAREKVRRIKRSAGKIRRHSSRTAYDCPYEKDRPYAKPIRPTKKYATLGRPKGSKSRLIFRESDTDVLGSDISILEGEVVQFTDGKVPIKKSKLRRKRRNPDVDTDSSDTGEDRGRTKPTKKRHRRQDGEVIVDGSDADISCSDDDAPYKRGDGTGLGGLSSFLSFLPLRGDTMELFGPNFPRWDYQTRPNFPVIPHKPKGKQRGRPRETFWDKTFPSFQESQTNKRSLPIDDPTLEAEIAQYMSSHAPNPIISPHPPVPVPLHLPIPSLPYVHSNTCSLPSLPSLHTPSTTEPPTPTTPVLSNLSKLTLLAKQALETYEKKDKQDVAKDKTCVKSPNESGSFPFLSPSRKEDLGHISERNLTEGELQTLQSGDNIPAMASVIARRKSVPKTKTSRFRAKKALKRSSKRISKQKAKRAKIC
ncbi:DNA polymerase theta-like [Oopsacas minuta]|uniref:DNA-directed DNA polymerase n=1 Tax=Oopsacas minuta TaxID=111878 RepID=A0AAV7JWP8_9METZ|nr:DNA polymerase theta-like [Oopsacas minuta]